MPAALAIMNERPFMTIVAPKAASPLTTKIPSKRKDGYGPVGTSDLGINL